MEQPYFKYLFESLELAATIIGIIVAIFTLKKFIQKDKEKEKMIKELRNQVSAQKEFNLLVGNFFKINLAPILRIVETEDPELKEQELNNSKGEASLKIFTLYNDGYDARTLTWEVLKKEKCIIEFHMPTAYEDKIDDFPKNKRLEFSISYNKEDSYEAFFEIQFTYQDVNNNRYQQRLVYFNAVFTSPIITLPEPKV